MIKATGLAKKFDDSYALNTLDAQIPRGSIYGLIGSNGSGKSTLLRLIAGVYRPDEGSLTVEEQPVFENPSVKERIFFVSDEFYHFPQCTMDDMARFYSTVYPSFRAEQYERIAGHFPIPRDKKLSTFSKGMRRQAALVLALAVQADYLLLDEAFDGLDPIIRGALRKILADQVANRGCTVLITSHNLRELEDMCDHVGLLHKGRIVFEQELDVLKLGFCKIQAAFRPMVEQAQLRELLDIMQLQVQGSLAHMVVRGNPEEVTAALGRLGPIFCESVPLTLEEVFIHEMEAIGYDYNNVLF